MYENKLYTIDTLVSDVQGLIDMDDENEFSADDILVNLRAKRAAYVNKLSIIDARLDCGI